MGSEILQQIQKEFQQFGTLLDTKFDVAKAENDKRFSEMDVRLAELQRLNKSLNLSVGDLVEAQARHRIAETHGTKFAKSRTFHTLEDVARYLLSGDYGLKLTSNVLQGSTSALADKLIKEEVPQKFVRYFHDAVKHGASTDATLQKMWTIIEKRPWFDNDVVQPDKIRQCLGELKTVQGKDDMPGSNKQHASVVTRLGWVCQVLTAADMQAARDKLLEEQKAAEGAEGSIGLMLMQFAAAKPQPENTCRYKDLFMPSGMVECDVQGSVSLYATKALLNVGEVKRSGDDYGAGARQLEDRLTLFEWGIRCLRPEIVDFTKVGHLFMPDMEVKQRQRSEARQHMLIQLHSF